MIKNCKNILTHIFFENISHHYLSVNETTLDHIIIVAAAVTAVRSIAATQFKTLDVHI